MFLQEINCSSKLWRRINSILGNSTGVSMEYLKVDDNILKGLCMVNHANSYFVNIAENLTSNLQRNEPYVIGFAPNPFSFTFLPTDAHEVFMVIMSLKNKGNGLNDLSVLSLKINAQIFSTHISFLYNLSIEKETFPNSAKVACVIPAFKTGLKDSVDNYRPISNLPILSKVFEKLTLNRLTSFINRCELLSDCQFGFRQGRSITQAAVRLTSFITQAYHQKLYSVCFFLDLKKAFDTIDHPILFTKLFNYGFRGPVHNYLISYLSNRKQYVMVGDDKSDEREITKGVPQGSLIGPLLFLLYINDIVKAVAPDVKVVLFADDAAFFLSASSLQLLYDKLRILFHNLSSYLYKNKLIPNLKKSKLMMFSSKPYGPLENIVFNNEVIEWVKEYRYLGLTLTSTMSFGPHIDRICTRVSQYVGLFYYLSKFLPREVMMLLYNTFAMPHLILHIEVWGAAPNWHLNRLIIKQNKLLRSVLGVVLINGIPNMHTAEMYIELKVLNLKNLFKLYLFKFMVLMLKGLLPTFYDLLLRPLEITHEHNTRSSSLRHPMLTSEVERRAIAHQVIILKETLPLDMSLNATPGALFRRYKRYLMVNQTF